MRPLPYAPAMGNGTIPNELANIYLEKGEYEVAAKYIDQAFTAFSNRGVTFSDPFGARQILFRDSANRFLGILSAKGIKQPFFTNSCGSIEISVICKRKTIRMDREYHFK